MPNAIWCRFPILPKVLQKKNIAFWKSRLFRTFHLRVRSLSGVHKKDGGPDIYQTTLHLVCFASLDFAETSSLCPNNLHGLKVVSTTSFVCWKQLVTPKNDLPRLCSTQSTVLKRKFEVRRFEAKTARAAWTGPHKSLSELVQRCVGTKTEKNCGGSNFKGFPGCNTRPKCFSWRHLIWKGLSDKCPAPPKILTKNRPSVYTVRRTDS